jgi:hypothetical protein
VCRLLCQHQAAGEAIKWIEWAGKQKLAPMRGWLVFVSPEAEVYILPDTHASAEVWFRRRRRWYVGLYADDCAEALIEDFEHWLRVEASHNPATVPA